MLPLVKPSRSNKRDNLSLKINTNNTEPNQGLEQFPLIQSRTNSSNSSKIVDSPVLNSLENLLATKSKKSHVPSRSISGGYSYNKSALHSSGTESSLSSGSSLNVESQLLDAQCERVFLPAYHEQVSNKPAHVLQRIRQQNKRPVAKG
ncbi:hypothetical protein AYI70_g1705 [Smittium culicis]|uniref:Uncharacterized protein n=1 Tax=Smittium culicis TaxID=133412 RepID=A0A1R1YBF2_9FUNG|nr:hypothetical protein AYI70_g1705 [Smittium culicis]